MKFFNKKGNFSRKRDSSLTIGSSLPPIDQYQIACSNDMDGSLNEEDYETKLNTIRNSTMSNEARSILRKGSRSSLRDSKVNSTRQAAGNSVSNAAAAAALSRSNTMRRSQPRAVLQPSQSNNIRYNSMQNIPRKIYPHNSTGNSSSSRRSASLTRFNENSSRNGTAAKRTSSLTNSGMAPQNKQYLSPKRSNMRSNSLNYSPVSNRASSLTSLPQSNSNQKTISSGRNMSITSMLTNNSLDISDMTIQSTTTKKGNTVIRRTKIIDSSGTTRRILTKTIKKVGAYEVVNSNVVNLSANDTMQSDFGLNNETLNELAELDEMEEDYDSLMLNNNNGVASDYDHHFDGFDQPMILQQSPDQLQQQFIRSDTDLAESGNNQHPYINLSEIPLVNSDYNTTNLSAKSKVSINNEILEETIIEEDEQKEERIASEDKKEEFKDALNDMLSPDANGMITPSNISDETNLTDNSNNKESSQSSNTFEPNEDEDTKIQLIKKSTPITNNNISKSEIPVQSLPALRPEPPFTLPVASTSVSSLDSGDAVFFDAPSPDTGNSKSNQQLNFSTKDVKQAQQSNFFKDNFKSKHAPMRSSMRSDNNNNNSKSVCKKISDSNFSASTSDIASMRSGRSKVGFRGGVEIINKGPNRTAKKLTSEEMYQSALRVAHERVYGTAYPEQETTTPSYNDEADNRAIEQANGPKNEDVVNSVAAEGKNQAQALETKADAPKPKKMKWFNKLFKL